MEPDLYILTEPASCQQTIEAARAHLRDMGAVDPEVRRKLEAIIARLEGISPAGEPRRDET